MDKKAINESGIPGWANAMITLVVIVAAGTFIFSQLPQGAFPTDLSRIGQGIPTLVVTRDDSFIAGAEVMELINSIRPEYSDRVQFLAAHMGLPDGQTFASRYDVQDGSVILFAGDGSWLATLHTPKTVGDIQQILADANIR